jgi:ADP-ribose pyrophosphatase YjhB (NUDIX family)
MTKSVERRRPVVGVGALILRPDGAVLLGHRIKQGERPTWCLPGGNVEPKETFEAAAVRETAEETGILHIGDPQVFTVVLNTEGERCHVTVGVIARVADPDSRPTTPEPHIFDQWAWVPPDQLPGPLFSASAALLDIWRGLPLASGWSSYPIGQALRKEN